MPKQNVKEAGWGRERDQGRDSRLDSFYLMAIDQNVHPELGHIRQGDIFIAVEDLKRLADETSVDQTSWM